MLKKPKFSKYFPVQADKETVFLLSERDSVELRDDLYQLLAPSIDGHRTVEEIVEEVLPYLLPKEAGIDDLILAGVKAHYALVQMEEQGYIVESEDDSPSVFAAFRDYLNISSREMHRRLATTKVTVKAIGSTTSLTGELISALQSLQIQVADEGDLEVVLTDDYLHGSLEEFNRNALEKARPWMLVQPRGTIARIGPIFQPRNTACWHCLAHHLLDNLPVENYLRKKGIDASAWKKSPAFLDSSVQTSLNMVATEIFKWIAGGRNPELEGNLLTYDVLKSRIDSHPVLKRPQCPVCGVITPGARDEPRAIALGRRKKVFVADGGYRNVAPEDTWKKYQHLIDPVTGIARSIEKVSPEFSPLFHTYVARHNCELGDIESLRVNISGRSAGKGKTDITARVSALGEALERYSAVFQGDEIRYRSNYHNLGERAIHPNTCLNFSSAQYSDRENWNENCSSLTQRVPLPFDEDLERDWTPVWSLTHEEFKYLPTAYCYSGYPRNIDAGDCPADSNGRAAGNTLEEAILQGFLELVERDAVALWWYNRTSHPGVDLASFDEPYFQALQEEYRTLDRQLWVLDITSDLNIPTFAAVSRRTDNEVEDIVLGYGAHLDATLALGRALTEVNQILPAVLDANADGTTRYKSYEPLAVQWWKTAKVREETYLSPSQRFPLKRSEDYSRIDGRDLFDDIELCRRSVEERGMETLVLDQTRPDIGMKVVKVIVPGLRHFWRRLAPGRLYDIPARSGRLDSPLREEQLNPFPMWM